MLYERDVWVNENITSIFNKKIYEYDIRSAGINLIIKYKLLPEDLQKKFLNMEKEERNVQIGLKERDDKPFAKALSDAFKDIRRMFFESNGLNKNDIVSIKKDAIFVTRECVFTVFDNVEFRVKNEYTSYIRLKKLEFYYNEDKMDIKGMNERDLQYHEEYMLAFIRKYIQKMEYGDHQDVLSYLCRFIMRYKKRLLDVEYYKEFKAGGLFKIASEDNKTPYSDFPEERKDELDIYYNMKNIIIPMILIAV